MQKCLFLLFFFLICTLSHAIETPLEQFHYQRLPNTQEINKFLTLITENNPQAKFIEIGKSAGGRDLKALLYSKDPEFLKSAKTSKDKVSVLLIGSQHGGEASGIEALQKLAVDLSENKVNYLDTMDLILIVNANPDGRDNFSRVNAFGKNLNIDFLMQSQPETQAFTALLNTYKPHIILDLHESSLKKPILSEEGYLTEVEAQYESANNPNIHPELLALAQNRLLPDLIKISSQNGLPSTHYRGEIQRLNQNIGHGGLHLSNLRNYAGLIGSLTFLVENRLDPKQEKYPTPDNIKVRRAKQYISVLSFLSLVQKHKESIIKTVEVARSFSNAPLYLQAQYTLNPQKPYVKIPLKSIKTNKIELINFPNADYVEIRNPTLLVSAFAIQTQQEKLKKLLTKHSIHFEELQNPQKVLALPLQITHKAVYPSPWPGRRDRLAIDAVYSLKEILLQKGDLIIRTDQPHGRLVPLLFDPRSMDSIYQEEEFNALISSKETTGIFPIARILP